MTFSQSLGLMMLLFFSCVSFLLMSIAASVSVFSLKLHKHIQILKVTWWHLIKSWVNTVVFFVLFLLFCKSFLLHLFFYSSVSCSYNICIQFKIQIFKSNFVTFSQSLGLMMFFFFFLFSFFCSQNLYFMFSLYFFRVLQVRFLNSV